MQLIKIIQTVTLVILLIITFSTIKTSATSNHTEIKRDKVGNSANVSGEVVVESKYKILITRRKGNTAKYGRSAYFTISLSHKPTHPVEIYVESDNPNEGIVPKKESWGWDMKTGRIVIHPKDWKRGEQIVIKGRNKNVINGKQDYHIVTSPAVSDDPHFNGVDAEDVWMRGEYLELIKPKKDILIVPNHPYRLRLGINANMDVFGSNLGIRETPFKLLNKPKGMELEDYSLIWTPQEEDGGKTLEISIEILVGKKKYVETFTLKVAKLSKPIKTVIKGNKLIISADKSCSLPFSNNEYGHSFIIEAPKGKEGILHDVVVQRIETDILYLKNRQALSCAFTIRGVYSVFDEIKKYLSLALQQAFDFQQDVPEKFSFYISANKQYFKGNQYQIGLYGYPTYSEHFMWNRIPGEIKKTSLDNNDMYKFKQYLLDGTYVIASKKLKSHKKSKGNNTSHNRYKIMEGRSNKIYYEDNIIYENKFND